MTNRNLENAKGNLIRNVEWIEDHVDHPCVGCHYRMDVKTNWAWFNYCTLVPMFVPDTIRSCDLGGYTNDLLKALPLSRRRLIRMSEDKITLADGTVIDPQNLAPIGDKIVINKKWDLTHKDLVGVSFIVISFAETSTSYGDCLITKIVLDGEQKTALIGGEVLRKQLKEVERELPLVAQIEKQGRYYSFVSPR